MSVQAMAWAIEQQEVREPETQLVLMCLANYAAADGANAFPSIQRLTRDSRLSESTVRRQLQKLEKMSLIRRGNQAITAAFIIRPDRRPTVYDLLMSRGVYGTPREPNGVSAEALRGVKNGPTGCQSLTPDPSLSGREPKSVLTKAEKAEMRRAALAGPQALASLLAQSKKV